MLIWEGEEAGPRLKAGVTEDLTGRASSVRRIEMGAGVSASPHCAELMRWSPSEDGHRSHSSGVASLPCSPGGDWGGSAALLGAMLSRSAFPFGPSKRAGIVASGA